MRFKTFLASLCVASMLAVTAAGGIMDNPQPAPPADPSPTPAVSANPVEPSDTSTADASATSDLLATIAATLIPLAF